MDTEHNQGGFQDGYTRPHTYPGTGAYAPPQGPQGPPMQQPMPPQYAPNPSNLGMGYPSEPPSPQQHRRSGRAGLFAGALVLALVSGGVGGAVGVLATDSESSHTEATAASTPAKNALDAPKPSSKPTEAPAGSVQAVAAKVLPSVVMIKIAGDKVEGEGSGVILSDDGLILTNNHVATGAGPAGKLTVAFNDGSTASAKLIGADSVADIAVIKVDKTGLTPIEFGDSSAVQVGQMVVAIGSPLGLAGTVTSGIVSSLNRPVATSGDAGNQNSVIDAIQTDAAINPGNSGGALVDMTGKLVGINTAIATLGGDGPESKSGSIGLGFAIPVDQARRIAEELVKNGKATHALIGLQVPSQDEANGARVIEVTPGSAAEKAGIPKGVIITKIDDRRIDTGDALIAAIRSHKPGDKVTVTYTDDTGQNQKTVDVTLDEAPAEGGR